MYPHMVCNMKIDNNANRIKAGQPVIVTSRGYIRAAKNNEKNIFGIALKNSNEDFCEVCIQGFHPSLINEYNKLTLAQFMHNIIGD